MVKPEQTLKWAAVFLLFSYNPQAGIYPNTLTNIRFKEEIEFYNGRRD